MRAQRQYTSRLWFYLYYIPFIELAIRRADLIFTVSAFAKNQIVELMKLDAKKVHVAYNGVDERFFGVADSSASALPNGLHPDQYILFVGTFEARKNIERLIQAFALLKQNESPRADNLKLAIVGQSSSARHSDRTHEILSLVDDLGIKNGLVICGYISDSLLPVVYRNARLVAFPSLHEGFGLPIVEGFAAGVPVLTSNLCSMPEIAGSAALLVDPYNVQDILEKLELLCFDSEVRQQLVKAGAERVKEFTWEKSATKILLEMKKVLSR